MIPHTTASQASQLAAPMTKETNLAVAKNER